MPQVTLLFWVIKILTTCGGEAGAGFGSGRVALIVAVAVAVGVAYLAITRRDVQAPGRAAASRRPASEMASARSARDGY